MQEVLQGINLNIKAGERICITGPGGSGKTTLTNILAGFNLGFEGIVTINNYSIRDLDLTHLRDKIAKNISSEDIFDGSILDNITVGKPLESVHDAINALQSVGLIDTVNSLPQGLQTPVLSGGKGLSNTMLQKLILARVLAKKPELIILNDFFSGLKKTTRMELIQMLIAPEHKWTVVVISNDPLIMAACERVVILHEGRIESDGPFTEILKQGLLSQYID